MPCSGTAFARNAPRPSIRSGLLFAWTHVPPERLLVPGPGPGGRRRAPLPPEPPPPGLRPHRPGLPVGHDRRRGGPGPEAGDQVRLLPRGHHRQVGRGHHLPRPGGLRLRPRGLPGHLGLAPAELRQAARGHGRPPRRARLAGHRRALRAPAPSERRACSSRSSGRSSASAATPCRRWRLFLRVLFVMVLVGGIQRILYAKKIIERGGLDKMNVLTRNVFNHEEK
ncbi:MAG: hypothetical protein M0C28_41940 [Candidatus Moduliflexus flocculans]|nr:hypothetical protein [Candidatus Moduliflexus flocculans]